MSEKKFDVIVLGTGPAGSSVAEKLAEQGRSVAIVESREFGGTCALRGCNPKKVYVNAAAVVDSARRSQGRLVHDPGVAIDWKQLLEFKREFTEPVLRTRESSLRKSGISTLAGSARFTSPKTLTVDEQSLSAERFVVATGAKPRPLDFLGYEQVTHSDEFLELSDLPPRLLFIGGGYISMEFAHVAARYGSQVTIVERGNRILDGFDPQLADLLTEYSRKLGIDFRFESEVSAIDTGEQHGYQAALSTGEQVACDLIIHGAGRVPNIDALDLAAAEVEFGEKGIVVNEFMQSTSNPRVFAAGDCVASGRPRLTPVANEEARIVSKNLLAGELTSVPDYGSVPAVAFTVPALSSVGLSEAEAREQGVDLQVNFSETSTWGSVRKTGDTVAGYKILIDKSNDRIVGAHLVGPAAEETINIFALALRYEMTATDLKATLFAFPTFASDIRRMV